jgi:hypothetical protein
VSLTVTDLGLHGGRWVPVKGVLRWQPSDADTAPTARDITTLIACPLCRATLTEHCRTSSGRNRWPHHSVRLVSRRCECGEVAQAGKKVCEVCQTKARRRAEWRDRKRKSRSARRKDAA